MTILAYTMVLLSAKRFILPFVVCFKQILLKGVALMLKSKKFLLLCLFIFVFLSKTVIATKPPLSLSELTARISQCKTNLDLLDYQTLSDNLETLKDLEQKLKNSNGEQLEYQQQEFEKVLENTYFLTYESPKVETRAIWIDNIYLSSIQSKSDIVNMMQWLHSMNFNVIIPDVFNQGQSIYPSKIVPQFDKYTVLYNGDILKDMVEEAHKLGMEIHPLIVLFGLDSGWELFIDEIELFDRDKNGKYVNIYGQAFLSPAVPKTRDKLVEIAREIASYGVDGIQLDYIRFSTGFGYGDYISDIFYRLNGIKPQDIEATSPLFVRYQEFKAQFISSFVDRCTKAIQDVCPKVIVSAAVQSPYTWGKGELFQDHRHWTQNRYIHSLMLMSYNYTAEEFSKHITTDFNYSKNQALIYPGMGLYNFDNIEYLRQIEASRRLPFSGQSSFSAIHLNAEKERYLINGPYREPAKNTMRDPLESAALILEDLMLRLEITSEISLLDEILVKKWQEELKIIALKVRELPLRSWPDRDLKEPNPIEYKLLSSLILEINTLIQNTTNLAFGSSRVALELQKVVSILEMFKHLSGPYSYTPISY